MITRVDLIFARHVAHASARTILFWLIGFCIYAGLIVAVYPSVEGAVKLDELPLNIRIAFNVANFDQLSGFLSAELMGVIMPILLPFFAIIMLSNAIAGAEERQRLDLILANPVPRRMIVLANSLVAFVGLLAIAVATGLTIWVMGAILGIEIALGVAVGGAFALWPLAIAFGGLAMLLSAVCRQRSTALAATGAFVLISYLTLVIARLVPDLTWLRYFSAFYYYGSAMVTGIWWTGVLVLIVAALLLTSIAVLAFDRRDIYT